MSSIARKLLSIQNSCSSLCTRLKSDNKVKKTIGSVLDKKRLIRLKFEEKDEKDEVKPSETKTQIKTEPQTLLSKTNVFDLGEGETVDFASFLGPTLSKLKKIKGKMPKETKERKVDVDQKPELVKGNVLFPCKINSCEKSEIMRLSSRANKESAKLPSVTAILNATMSEEARKALEIWEKKMIEKLGIEGFKVYKAGNYDRQRHFSTTYNDSSCAHNCSCR